MNPHDIKALLGKRGIKQKRIAASLRVSPSLVTGVIFQKTKSRRVATAISRAIGIPKSALWPELYGAKSRGEPDGQA